MNLQSRPEGDAGKLAAALLSGLSIYPIAEVCRARAACIDHHMSESSREIAQEFFKKGAFKTIRDRLDQRRISDEEAIAWTEQVFASYGRMIAEARKELVHLSAVLTRLDAAARAGSRLPRGKWSVAAPHIQRLGHEVSVFDNWVVSLYETDLSMIAMALPELAVRKPQEMARAFESLQQKRFDAVSLKLKDPSLFR